MFTRHQIRFLTLAACLLCSAACQSRPSVGLAKDDRDVAAIWTADHPTREELRDHILTVAKKCWLNNKSPAFFGLVLRTSEPHPKVPNGYYLTFNGPKNSSRYLNIHIIPADDPDGGYMVYVDQESKNKEAVKAISQAIRLLELKYRRSFYDSPNQPLC